MSFLQGKERQISNGARERAANNPNYLFWTDSDLRVVF